MPKARKLPSGSWRCQIYKNGVRKSFTVADPSPSGRRLCERLASEWAEQSTLKGDMTVETAIRLHIEAKKRLSPTTKVGYLSMLGHSYDSIKDRTVLSLTDKVVQKWIDERARDYSPKSIRNEYALLNSAVYRFTGMRFRCELPEGKDREYITPSDEDVSTLLKETEGTELHKAIILAAFGTLREGECSALTKDDIEGNQITVRHSYGWDGEKFILKEPKNRSSVRTVSLPEDVMQYLVPNEDGRIVGMDPRQISHRFVKVARRLGMKFRFHDLRAYAASVRHAEGIPDVYIMADGGWKTDTVLKRVYRRALDEQRKEFSKVSNDHFSRVIAHEITHDNEKSP